MTTEELHRFHDLHLAKRLARRWTVLQVLGALLMLMACTVEWAPPDDPALPPTRPFLLMVGALVFATGRFMKVQWAQSRSDGNYAQPITPPPPDDEGSQWTGGSKQNILSPLFCPKQIHRFFIRS